MSKKIVILNGSPRKRGNTAALVEAFTAGAEAAGNTVTTFYLQEMDIHFCLGCYGGGGDPKSPCVQKDDMDKIYPAYLEADVIVTASPLYYYTLSGQVRTCFDRLLAVMAELGPDYRVSKESVLLMAAGGNDYEDVIRYYQSLNKRINWKDLGMVLVGGVNKVGDIAGNPKLEEARALGASIG